MASDIVYSLRAGGLYCPSPKIIEGGSRTLNTYFCITNKTLIMESYYSKNTVDNYLRVTGTIGTAA